jgi:hypothetical protein
VVWLAEQLDKKQPSGKPSTVIDVSQMIFQQLPSKNVIYTAHALIDRPRRIVYGIKFTIQCGDACSYGYYRVPDYGDAITVLDENGNEVSVVGHYDEAMSPTVSDDIDMNPDEGFRNIKNLDPPQPQSMAPVHLRRVFEKKHESDAKRGGAGTGTTVVDAKQLMEVLGPLIRKEVDEAVTSTVRIQMAAAVKSILDGIEGVVKKAVKDTIAEETSAPKNSSEDANPTEASSKPQFDESFWEKLQGVVRDEVSVQTSKLENAVVSSTTAAAAITIQQLSGNGSA